MDSNDVGSRNAQKDSAFPVGGLEHVLFFHIVDVIIPID